MQSITASGSKQKVMREILASFPDGLVKTLVDRDHVKEPFRTALEAEWDRRFHNPDFEDEDIDPQAFLDSFNLAMTEFIGDRERQGYPVNQLLTLKLDSNRTFYDA